MGWLWSTSPKSVEASSSPTTTTTAPPPPWPTPTPPASSPSPSPSPPQSQSQPEQKTQSKPPADAALQELLDFLDSDAAPQQPPTKPSSSSSSSSSSPSSPRVPAWLANLLTPSTNPFSSNKTPPLPPRTAVDPVSEALLPTSMSCRQAFDHAWACNSVGGQWKSVYRYGSIRSCSDLWADFWFCMRHRASPDGPVKQSLIRSHYRSKEHARYHAPGQPSSQDVWAPRPAKLPPEAIFPVPVDQVDFESFDEPPPSPSSSRPPETGK